MAFVSFATSGPGSSHRTIGRRRKPSSSGESDRGRSGHTCTRGTSVMGGAGSALSPHRPHDGVTSQGGSGVIAPEERVDDDTDPWPLDQPFRGPNSDRLI